MRYTKSEIETIKNVLLLNGGNNPTLLEARQVIIQLEKENAMLKEQIEKAGLPETCGFCPKFINRVKNVGQCKLLSGKIMKADQDCCCPALRGKL